MRVYCFFIIILFFSCKQEKTPLTAQQIIDKSIRFSGVNVVKTSKIAFTFKNIHYVSVRNNGVFKLSRSFIKNNKTIKDVLTNSSFERFINDSLVSLTEKKKNAYSNSINSVHYFSLLPFGLNDKAVHKKLLPSVKIKGVDYYKIQVTFSEENGGEDFDDVFLYWFNKENFQLDYFAYTYHINGGGIRFRDIKNEQRVNGIRFVNYNNYKPKNKTINFNKIDVLYEENKLIKLSEIVLKNVEVTFNR